MRRGRADGPDTEGRERGESLIELMVTITIMSVAVLALVGSVAVGLRLSSLDRKQAAVSTHLRSFAEALNAYIAADPTEYVACATTATYASAFTIADTNYVASITAVRYWDGTLFVSACSSDLGIQLVTLEVHSADNEASESLDVIIRRPCRPTADYTDPAC